MYGIVYENIKKPAVVLATSADALTTWADQSSMSAFFVATEDDMKAVPGSVLVALYNLANSEKAPIKKFETKTVAMRRVFMVLRDLAKAAPVEVTEETASGDDDAGATARDNVAEAASPAAAKAKSKRAKKAKTPAGEMKATKVAIPKGSRFKGPFAQGRAPAHVRNWPKSANGDPVAPRDGTKGAKVLTMLRKGTTYEKIKAAFDWTSQGVSDALSYLRRCGFGIKTDGDGAMSIVE